MECRLVTLKKPYYWKLDYATYRWEIYSTTAEGGIKGPYLRMNVEDTFDIPDKTLKSFLWCFAEHEPMKVGRYERSGYRNSF